MLKITALKRTNEKIKTLRDDGFVPAVVYGNPEFVSKSINIKFKKLDFQRVLDKAGQHTLIDLLLDGFNEPVVVIIKDVQRNFVNNSISHVDLYCVNMKKEIVADVPIKFVGESSAVRNFGGILVKHSDDVKIKCLPGNLIEEIDIDVSALKTLENSLHFRDLTLPDNVELITDANRVIVNVTQVKKVEKKGAEEAPTPEKKDEKKDEKEKVEKK